MMQCEGKNTCFDYRELEQMDTKGNLLVHAGGLELVILLNRQY